MVSSTGIKRKFSKLCGPAQFYLVLSLVSLVIYMMNMLEYKHKMNTMAGIIIQGIIVLVWTCVLNWVCSLKYGTKVAWLLIFLPMLLIMGLLFVMYHFVDEMDLSKGDIQDIIRQAQQEDEVEGFCDDCA